MADQDIVFGLNTIAKAISGGASLQSVTVATLPAGAISHVPVVVTDGAGALALGATVTGGGTTKYLCWFNSVNWVVIGK